MSQTNKGTSQKKKHGFVFEKINYQLFLLSIAIVIIGFALMTGTEDIYSFTKITLAPLVVVIGFTVGFVAILYQRKTTTSATKPGTKTEN